MHSLECYFGVYFPRCCTTREINTKITLSWAPKQFATRVHTLFYIFMKPVQISKLSYADDTNLLSHLCLFSNSASAKNMKMEEISENINNKLISISEWLNIDKLYLNIKKTKFMLFHYHQHNINILTPKLAINSEPIERATECNFSGLTIDGHLSWTPHIQKITNKNPVPSELCVDWKGLCQLIYWSLCTPLLFCRLEKLQKRAIHTIANSQYNAHTDTL